MAIFVPSRRQLREGGEYYVASNPTPGTGLATVAAPTAFDETKAFVTVRNEDALTTGKSIIPDYLKLICTAAGTAGASTHLTVGLDSDEPNTKWTSGGTLLSPKAASGRNGSGGIAEIHAGALVTVAGPDIRQVSNSIFRTVIPVVGDEYLLVFGADAALVPSAVMNGTVPTKVVEQAPAVEIPPHWVLSFYLWLPSQSAASSWEVELGYWEGQA